MKYFHNKSGFSMMEIALAIVVLALLGLVISANVFGLSNKSKDIARLKQVKEIQSALNSYKQDVGIYPASLVPGGALVGQSAKTYMKRVPSDPTMLDDCGTSNYHYIPIMGGRSFTLDYCLSTPMGGVENGSQQAGPSALSIGTCGPNCIARTCGDDSCGGCCGGVCDKQTVSCTTLFGSSCNVSGNKTCEYNNFGTCDAIDPRIANCNAKNCGSDGCGGTCGICDPSKSDACTAGVCSCGVSVACTGTDSCVAGLCQSTCVPNCNNKTCGQANSCNTGFCDVDASCSITSDNCAGDPLECKCGSGPACTGDTICQSGVCVADCAIAGTYPTNMQRACPSSPSIGCKCGGGTVICNEATSACGARNIIASPGNCTSTTSCNDASDSFTRTWDNEILVSESATDSNNGMNNFWDDADGDGNPAAKNTASKYAAANFCLNLNINGKTDWYLPAKTEMCLVIRSAYSATSACNPGDGTAETGFVHAGRILNSSAANVVNANYWTSTEATASTTLRISGSGYEASLPKTNPLRIRCIRRFD